MLDIYSKDEKDDLTPAGRKRLRTIAQEYKAQIVAACRAAKKEQHE